MSDHKGLPVSGYVDQSASAVERVNAHKHFEEILLRILDAMQNDDTCDLQWTLRAREHIEFGFMAMNRAVFRPQRVKLDGE